ncbi:MAG TPA: metallophosphoesterase [Atribacteraceae bacterium]|nr:metallophosphoesterase [Atribacteraceae bacterium]
MKLLIVSDRVDPLVYSNSCRDRFYDVACVVSCGDLPEYYLDFVVSNLNVPLFFVHGNHDPSGGKMSLAGGINLDERVVFFKGVFLAGLEGSIWYNGGLHQYTERSMYWKYLKLVPKLAAAGIRRKRKLDVFVSHSPPAGLHEGMDPAHRGFKTFVQLIQKYKPSYHVHGHTHLYDRNQTYQDQLGLTTVINGYNYRILDLASDRHG